MKGSIARAMHFETITWETGDMTAKEDESLNTIWRLELKARKKWCICSFQMP